MLTAVADEMIKRVEEDRPLNHRERAVLEALLTVDFEGVEILRRQAMDVVVAGMCGCGCPSIDFQADRGVGMTIRVNAGVRGSYGGLFLYTIEDPQEGEVLGGIEWLSGEATDPEEFPPPQLLDIRAA